MTILTIALGVLLGNLLTAVIIVLVKDDPHAGALAGSVAFVVFLGGLGTMGYLLYAGWGSRILAWLIR